MERRLRRPHLMSVIEALARYGDDGLHLHSVSDGTSGKLQIAFTIDDWERFDRIVGELTSETDFSRDGNVPGPGSARRY